MNDQPAQARRRFGVRRIVLVVAAALILVVVGAAGVVGCTTQLRVGVVNDVCGIEVWPRMADEDHADFGRDTIPAGVGGSVRVAPWCVLHITAIDPVDRTGSEPLPPGSDRTITVGVRLW